MKGADAGEFQREPPEPPLHRRVRFHDRYDFGLAYVHEHPGVSRDSVPTRSLLPANGGDLP
jgi:hypothetical protein